MQWHYVFGDVDLILAVTRTFMQMPGTSINDPPPTGQLLRSQQRGQGGNVNQRATVAWRVSTGDPPDPGKSLKPAMACAG